MGVSFNAAFIPCTYAIIILTMNSIFKFFKFENIILLHSIQFDKCLLGIMELLGMKNQKKHHPSCHFFFFFIKTKKI